MYADSVFSESGGSDQYQMKDLIPDSILTYHVRSIRSAPSAYRALPVLSSGGCWTGQLAWESNPPKDLHGPPRTLVLPDGSIIVRSAGHGTNADAICTFGSSLRLSLLRKVRDHGAPVIACSQSERKFLMKGIQLSKFVPFSIERLF